MRCMPAIFFLALPPAGETGTGADTRSNAERDDLLGYSGHLSFDGGFDRFGFVPQRAYPGDAESQAVNRQPDPDAQPK